MNLGSDSVGKPIRTEERRKTKEALVGLVYV